MILDKSIFQRGIASGEAFCNRISEVDRLNKNIHKLTHTVLISPRRYGKTSLAYRAIEHSGLPCAHIDLFMKYDREAVTQEFFHGISSLMSKITKPTEQMLKRIESLLKNLVVSIKIGKFGFEFSLSPKKQDRSNLKFLLTGIDDFLAKNKKHAIIFIDEIQAIVDTPVCEEVESSLRSVAQTTKNITFIFSGSSRHLLSQLFDDQSRPLYKLCYMMPIKRISEEHYKSFINKLAKRVWMQPFSENAMNEIFYCTKLHPYYINILCGYLFENLKIPSDEDVRTIWEKVCREEQSSVAKDLEFLTAKQKHLLYEIAKQPSLKEPTAKEFVRLVNLTPKGISDGIKILLKYDLIEKLENGEIRVVDPVLDFWARK